MIENGFRSPIHEYNYRLLRDVAYFVGRSDLSYQLSGQKPWNLPIDSVPGYQPKAEATRAALRTALENPHSYDESVIRVLKEPDYCYPVSPIEGFFPGDSIIIGENNHWYEQEDLGTCTAWAVANSALCYGLTNGETAEIVYRLSWLAARDDGLSFELASQTIDVPEFNGVKLVNDASLFSTYHLARRTQETDNAKNDARVELIKTLPFLHTNWDNYNENIASNAYALWCQLTQGRPLMTSVVYETLYHGSLEDSDHHAVVINGMNVRPNGMIDIRIVDPHFGISWVGLEHLSMSLTDGKLWRLRKR